MKISTVKLKQQNYIVLDDGYYYFAPPIGCVMSPKDLRYAADCLDEMNEEWDSQVRADLSPE